KDPACIESRRSAFRLKPEAGSLKREAPRFGAVLRAAGLRVVPRVFLPVVLRVVIVVLLELHAVQHGADELRVRVLELTDGRLGRVTARHLRADDDDDAGGA